MENGDSGRAIEAERLTRKDAEEIAERVIAEKIKAWRGSARMFLIGFGAFLVVAGISWSQIRSLMFEAVYPFETLYFRFQEAILADNNKRTVVTDNILKLIGPRVDSGYSKVFYFGPGQINQPGQDILNFFALPEQSVEISVVAEGPPTAQFALLVDNGNAFAQVNRPNPTFPFKIFSRDITRQLNFPEPSALDEDAEAVAKQRNIHTIRLNPIGLPNDETATFEVLVLVRNAR